MVAKTARLRWLRNGREELTHVRGRGWRPGGATPARGQGRQPGGSTPHLRSQAAAKRNNPTSKEWWLCGCRRAERSYSTFKVRRGVGEEIPLVQGKEQRMRFAGVAMKRYPMSKVRETQVRG